MYRLSLCPFALARLGRTAAAPLRNQFDNSSPSTSSSASCATVRGLQEVFVLLDVECSVHVIIDYNSINNYRMTNRFPKPWKAPRIGKWNAIYMFSGTRGLVHELAEINCPD